MSCRGTIGGDFFGAPNGQAKDVVVITELAADGTVLSFAIRPNRNDGLIGDVLTPFFAWVEENHPEELATMSKPADSSQSYDREPVFTPETAPLITQLLDEWKQSLP